MMMIIIPATTIAMSIITSPVVKVSKGKVHDELLHLFQIAIGLLCAERSFAQSHIAQFVQMLH